MKKTVLSIAVSLTAFCATPTQAQSEWMSEYAWNEAPLHLTDDLTTGGVCLQPSLLLNEWYADLNDGLIQPYATYSLTPEEQEAYLAIIKALWPWNYSNMQANEVNDAMADIINKMLWEISNCSKAMVGVHIIAIIYSHFISGGTIKSLDDLKDFIEDNDDAIVGMINVIRGNMWYRTCADTAAWIWKSPFEIAYGDY